MLCFKLYILKVLSLKVHGMHILLATINLESFLVFLSSILFFLYFKLTFVTFSILFNKIWIKTFSNLPEANWVTLLIFVIAFLVIIIFQVVNKYIITRRLYVTLPCYLKSEKRWEKKRFKWSVPIPSQLIVVSNIHIHSNNNINIY